MPSSDQAGSSLNGSGTESKSGTPLTRWRSPDVHGWTYFIQGDCAIKIGRSVQPRARMRELQAGSGSELELLLAVPHGRLSESEAHQQFWHLRMHGEWFRPASELLDFIALLKAETKKPIRLARPNKPPASLSNGVIGQLHGLRHKHGFETPIGHRCSNLAELLRRAPEATHLIRRQMTELERLLA